MECKELGIVAHYLLGLDLVHLLEDLVSISGLSCIQETAGIPFTSLETPLRENLGVHLRSNPSSLSAFDR